MKSTLTCGLTFWNDMCFWNVTVFLKCHNEGHSVFLDVIFSRGGKRECEVLFLMKRIEYDVDETHTNCLMTWIPSYCGESNGEKNGTLVCQIVAPPRLINLLIFETNFWTFWIKIQRNRKLWNCETLSCNLQGPTIFEKNPTSRIFLTTESRLSRQNGTFFSTVAVLFFW